MGYEFICRSVEEDECSGRSFKKEEEFSGSSVGEEECSQSYLVQEERSVISVMKRWCWGIGVYCWSR